jgi:molybdopterin-guanine dinucleotide biosynthesis protein A
LAERMAQALSNTANALAMASGPETDEQGRTQMRAQPVFCLLRVELLESLVRFTHGGGRKIDQWTAQHPNVLVPFDQAHDDPLAFANANTLVELQKLAR